MVNRQGWLFETERSIDTTNQYSLETVVSKLVPEEIDNEVKNIRIERLIFAEDDNSPTYRRAMRLVPEEEWRAKQGRYRQPPYLIMLFRTEENHEEKVKGLLNKDLFLKESVDLREYFSDVSIQEGMTCTAHAGKALMEYFQNRASNRTNNQLSWRFLYKVTRDLMDVEKDALKQGGATLRDTLRAMVLFGIPPERSDRNWITVPDKTEKTPELLEKAWLAAAKTWLDNEENRDPNALQPSAFAFAYAQNYQATKYFRLDKLRENYQKGLLTLDKLDGFRKNYQEGLLTLDKLDGFRKNYQEGLLTLDKLDGFRKNYQEGLLTFDELDDLRENYQKGLLTFDELDDLRENYQKGLLTFDKDSHDVEVGQLTVAQIRIALSSGFPAIFGISDVSFIENFIKQEDLDKIKQEDLDKNNKQDKPKNIKLGQVRITKENYDKLQKLTPPRNTIGHALVAVGYDDNLEFYLDSSEKDEYNLDLTKEPIKGGFLFRDSRVLIDSQGNELKDSQGKKLAWGDNGYGWIPYEYVEKGLATDWWSLLNAEWINTSDFGIGTDQILGHNCNGQGCR